MTRKIRIDSLNFSVKQLHNLALIVNSYGNGQHPILNRLNVGQTVITYARNCVRHAMRDVKAGIIKDKSKIKVATELETLLAVKPVWFLKPMRLGKEAITQKEYNQLPFTDQMKYTKN